MAKTLIRFANLLLAGLVVGTMFGIWLGFNPRLLSSSACVEQQQSAIRQLNITMPVLGAICIVLTVAHAFVVRFNRFRFYLLLLGAIFLVFAGVVTRFGNQPINAIVMTWLASAPPSIWVEARDQWWRWHIVRTIAGFAGFCCVISASITPNVKERPTSRNRTAA